jgi:cytoskeletal protein CcmA (bactofilin family)
MASASVPPNFLPTPPAVAGDVRDVGSVRRDAVVARSYTVLGTAKVLGDVTVGHGDFQGFTTVGGRLTADQLRSHGGLVVSGATVVKGELEVRGNSEFGGPVSAGEFRAHGTVRMASALTVNGVATIDGVLQAVPSIAARGLTLSGGLHVDGIVESPTVVLRLRRRSRILQVHSQHVRIVRASPFAPREATLLVDRIEAVEVQLEGVDCEYLRADRVRLGAGCHIGRVDGTVLRRHRSAVVGPLSRSPPPFGLSR